MSMGGTAMGIGDRTRSSSPGIAAPRQTRVAWPPQKAWMPNHMLAMKTRRMTGTGARASRQRGSGAHEPWRRRRRKTRTIAPPHAPGEATADGEANVVVGAHGAADDGEEAGEESSDNLNFVGSIFERRARQRALTTTPMACWGLRPKASRVLPRDHAEMLEPVIVQ